MEWCELTILAGASSLSDVSNVIYSSRLLHKGDGTIMHLLQSLWWFDVQVGEPYYPTNQLLHLHPTSWLQISTMHNLVYYSHSWNRHEMSPLRAGREPAHRRIWQTLSVSIDIRKVYFHVLILSFPCRKILFFFRIDFKFGGGGCLAGCYAYESRSQPAF